jgi:uncharacterized protein (DUF1697 family)
MNLWVAFFRGINVGGHNILPMKGLRALLSDLGCADVSTYIQSGNVVFRHNESKSAPLQAKISREILKRFSLEPIVFLMTSRQLVAAHARNPFPDGEREPKTLHLHFLAADTEHADWDAFRAMKSDSERYKLVGHVLYLYAPEGIGRSKLAAKIERLLGVPTTARNWRTVEKVLQLAANTGAQIR